jgi:hypothetical protein
MKTSRRVMQISDMSPQDVACLRAVYIMRYGQCCLSCDKVMTAHQGRGDLGMSYDPSTRSEYVLIMYVDVHAALNACVPFEG